VQLVGLTAGIDPNSHFVEIVAQASLPDDVIVLNPADDRYVFIEPTNAGISKSGFE
jgi:hypothetical protein